MSGTSIESRLMNSITTDHGSNKNAKGLPTSLGTATRNQDFRPFHPQEGTTGTPAVKTKVRRSAPNNEPRYSNTVSASSNPPKGIVARSSVSAIAALAERIHGKNTTTATPAEKSSESLSAVAALAISIHAQSSY